MIETERDELAELLAAAKRNGNCLPKSLLQRLRACCRRELFSTRPGSLSADGSACVAILTAALREASRSGKACFIASEPLPVACPPKAFTMALAAALATLLPCDESTFFLKGKVSGHCCLFTIEATHCQKKPMASAASMTSWAITMGGMFIRMEQAGRRRAAFRLPLGDLRTAAPAPNQSSLLFDRYSFLYLLLPSLVSPD